MQFGVLGSVEARKDGDELSLGGPKQRALLAILLLDPNQVVSRDRLIDGLWGERPPPSAGHTLDDYISRLRKVLGADRIETRPPGYAVRVQPGELDLGRFESLVEQGRGELARGDTGEASSTLRAALALWRGPALADVLYEPFASIQAGRLEERRLATIEDRLEADLALGRGSELIAEIEALVYEHPLREGLVRQLMLAFYRSGQQAKALEVFRSARQRFAQELGLDPGPQLQKLEEQILRQDPNLDPSVKPRTTPRQRKRRRRVVIVVAMSFVASCSSVAAGLVLRAQGTTTPRPGVGMRNELVGVSMDTRRADQSIGLSGPPAAIASGKGSLWVVDTDGGSVSQVDPQAGTVIDRIPIAGGPGEIAAGGDSIWVASTLGGIVSRIDPSTGKISQTISLGVNQSSLDFGAGQLWVADPSDASLIRIDEATGTPEQTVSLADRPANVGVHAGEAWVASHDAGTLTEIDSHTNETVATVSVGQGPTALAFGAGAVWVANSLDGTVSRIDPQKSKVVATISTGSGPTALTFAAGSLWVANEFSSDVSVIDPGRNEVVKTIQVAGRPTSLASTAGRVWIGVRPSGEFHRGGTLTLLGFRPHSIDPAFNFAWYPPPQFLGLSYDTLVTFQHTAGPDGLHLVPDLALALAVPTRAARSYTFRLRPGIHYANGIELKASDVRRGIQRLFRVGSPGAAFYTNIVGGGLCAKRPRSCDLSRGIVTNDTARSVVFRLAVSDPELLFKLALPYATPVPPGTPSRDIGSKPIPGTGPYRIVRSTARGIKFGRNALFREWSHAAQPAGYPDAIRWRYDLSPTAQTLAVERGQADWMFEQIPARLKSRIEIRHAAQLRISPALGTEFLLLDTRVPPFNKLAVRQALNYAIDRDGVARLYGGGALATPTCQVLPPGLPGYHAYCPYTLHPREHGRWIAPDLARARRLVAASGTYGRHVTVWATDRGFHATLARFVAGVLRSLGYRAQMRLVSDSAAVPGGKQLVTGTWFGGELGPTDFLQSWFACKGSENNGRYCDPRLDELMRRASAYQATDPDRAANAWAAVDRRVVDSAGWVPLVTPREVEFISQRVGNYQYHPIWGLLADQLWLH